MEKQVVLITGCSSGFGKALCEKLSARGYYVVASARNVEKLKDTNGDMKVALDVTRLESIKAALDKIMKRTGRIDVLINNAGYSVRSAVEEIDMKALKNMYEVNVFGMLQMMQEVLPIMRKQKKGRIVNIGSISGRMTQLLNGGYCGAKHSVEAITEAARYELSDMGIEVCVVEPGAMDTNFFETMAKNSDEKMNNTESVYRKFYEHDIEFRKKQFRSDVEKCADDVVRMLDRRKLKVRYTVGVSFAYKLFIKMPNNLKEWIIKRV